MLSAHKRPQQRPLAHYYRNETVKREKASPILGRRGNPIDDLFLPGVPEFVQQMGPENIFLRRKKKGNSLLIDSLLQQNGNEGPLTQTRPFLHEVRRKESRERALGQRVHGRSLNLEARSPPRQSP